MKFYKPRAHEWQFMVSKLIGVHVCMGRMHCFYFHKSCLLQIVFPNGSIDPWHALGIVRNVSTTEQAVYIQGMKRVTGSAKFIIHMYVITMLCTILTR